MKIWQEFGSSHSGNVTVIGTFESEEVAQNALPLLEDFINAHWKDRYPSIKEFNRRWKDQYPNIEFIGPNEVDFQTGLDGDPEIFVDSNKVVITKFSTEHVHGIVKLMFMLNKKKIEITGTGP